MVKCLLVKFFGDGEIKILLVGFDSMLKSFVEIISEVGKRVWNITDMVADKFLERIPNSIGVVGE